MIAASDDTGPKLGIIDQPYIGERFMGGLGRATLTGPLGSRDLAVRTGIGLAEATVFTTFPEVGTPDEGAAFARVSQAARLTRYGCDCYAYALLAAGQIDLVIEAGLNAYDIHAPIAVIEAAGGLVTDWDGRAGARWRAGACRGHAGIARRRDGAAETMTAVLLKGAAHVLTMDGPDLTQADVRFADGCITHVGKGLSPDGAEVHDATGCVITPGLVNTHHHLFQTLTRAVPEAQDALLFGWLRALYPIWARFGPDEMRLSAELGLAELALSGCTTSSDHLYLFPNGARLDDTIEAAAKIGLRFHATRGAMSIGESQGGLPPDALVEREADILEDALRLIDAFHDPTPGAMVRIAVAPCSPFSVSRELMRDAALLARDKGVGLHTHLAENDEDVAYSLAQFGCRPGTYAEDLGWTGPDVWHAHCVKLDAGEIDLFAKTGTAVAHCPCSNCRLGSGIAPVRAMRDAGVTVGLGVDGSASNDQANLIGEARQAMLLQRVAQGADAMPAREALELATKGGAKALNRDDIGRIAPGLRADLAVWDVSGIESAGSWDPAALVLAGPRRVRDLFVDGRRIVSDGQCTTLDTPIAAEAARQAVARLSG